MDRDFLFFLKDAYNGGLCNEYRDEIRRCHENKAELISLALRQQSIPYVATKMREGSLTKSYVQETFGEYLNGFVLKNCDGVEGYTYSWFLDWDYDNDLDIEVDVAHISHTVGANVIVPKVLCPTIYLSNRSNVHLICEGNNSVNIKLFDESKVTIEDTDENSSVVVYKYSPKAKVETGKYCLIAPKVFEKELKI